jgi:tetratricopeptide (TPR) repeat protein
MTQTRLPTLLVLVAACAHPIPAPIPAATPAPAATAAPAPAKSFAPVPAANPLLAEIATAERAAADHPDDAETWGRLASALRRANRLQEAARAAWRTVELAPSAESWTSLGNLLMQGGAPTGAMAAFEEVSRQTNDGFLAAQNFLNLGYRAWLWGMDDFAMRAYARAEEVAPGHPQVLYNRTLLFAASGKVATAQAEATKLRNVVDRVLQDLPPLEMVEILEPMKALTESVISGNAVARLPPQPEPGQHLPDRFWRRDPGHGHALDLAVDETSERYYPIAGWQVLALKLPSGWTDSLEVTKGRPISARIRIEASGPRPVLWLLTVTESRQASDLDRLIVEAQRNLSGTPTLGDVRAFTGRDLEGRAFVADDFGARPEDRAGFLRVWVAALRAKGFLVTASRFLHDRDPNLVDESERILRALEVRDLTPPRR